MGILTLGHGSGGRLTQKLIERLTVSFESNGTVVRELEDCALLPEGLGVTIDGFTVTPLVFPGGNLGKLSVCGSVNDLSVRGVRPLYLALSVIAEEGLDENELFFHMQSASDICKSIGISLVAGDTKVVPHGQLDKLFLTTCALGVPLYPERKLGMSNVEPGDILIVTGPLGRHGASIAACRYHLDSQSLESDCAPLWPLLEPLLHLPGLRCMRDCTRGGLGTVLCEWAEGRGIGILVEEDKVPKDLAVSSICDILGLDPFYLACEGTAVIAVAPETEEEALFLLKKHSLGKEAATIGKATKENPGWVGLRTMEGGIRVIDMPVGELLPRIC